MASDLGSRHWGLALGAMATVRVSLQECEAICRKALQKRRLNETAILAISENITAAERDGCRSHGLFRLPGYCLALERGKASHDALPEVKSLAPSCVVSDAKGGFSVPACLAGHSLLVEKAKASGVAVLLIQRAFHFAALWQDVEPLAAKHGLVAMAFLNSKAFVAHWPGGLHPLYGTNPMAFACPRRGVDGLSQEPFVFDQATSMMARGDMTLAARDGETIPPNAAIDKHGQLTTDPVAGIGRGAVADGWTQGHQPGDHGGTSGSELHRRCFRLRSSWWRQCHANAAWRNDYSHWSWVMHSRRPCSVLESCGGTTSDGGSWSTSSWGCRQIHAATIAKTMGCTEESRGWLEIDEALLARCRALAE